MQIFELLFNPKGREELVFDSFCFDPTNIYEKRLGGLYMVGELKNALPENYRFLNNLAQVVKGAFYSIPVQSREKSFKNCLKKANEFLKKEVEENNTRWLGNLNFAIISLKDLNLSFTKVGDIKILLLRGGQIIDIGKKLELEEFEPYPLKIFSNVVSGKLSQEDIILIATKEIFSVFKQREIPITLSNRQKNKFLPQNLLEKIATQFPFEEKELRKILKEKEKLLAETPGVCLLIVLKPKILTKEALKFETKAPLFSIKEALLPLKEKIKKVSQPLQKISRLPQIPKIKVPFSFQKTVSKLPKPFSTFKKTRTFFQLVKKEILETFQVSKEMILSKSFRKKSILILALAFFLFIGFFAFQRQKEIPLEKAKKTFPEIQEKITMAENFLILKEEKKANSLLQEAWNEILPLVKEDSSVKKEAQLIKANIEEKLFELNKLEKIEEPEILFEFDKKDISAKKMVNLDKILYFYNPYFKGFLQFDGKESKIETEEAFELATPFDKNSIVFFLSPNRLIFWQKNQFGPEVSLKLPFSEFQVSNISVFAKNIYLFDKKTGEIIKYKAPLVVGKNFPEYWLSNKTQKPKNAKSITVDGSIWILTKENKINRYYMGNLQETFTLNIFPTLKNVEKILTNRNSPYLFLLEPEQNRIIILNKSGKLIKQFQSEKFNNLKDFAVSKDGTIYLLNESKVYQIKF